MKIKILGTRGEIEESAPYHSKKSGVLIDNTLLLDCGQPEFLKQKFSYILITHLHPDHAFFVRTGHYQKIDFPLYAPEKFQNMPIMITNSSFSLDGYTIVPIPTIHSLKVKSNAYLIIHNKKKILYTGDMIWIEKMYHHLLEDLDLVITEASSMRQGGLVRRDAKTGKVFGHTGVPNLVSLFKKYTSTIAFVHFGAWFYKDMKTARKKFSQLARENDVEIIVGYDGLEFTI